MTNELDPKTATPEFKAQFELVRDAITDLDNAGDGMCVRDIKPAYAMLISQLTEYSNELPATVTASA